MAKGQVPLKFQVRLETPRGWEALSDEDKAATYSALVSVCESVGAPTKNMYGPHWEETNVSRSLTELVWEITVPLRVVEYVGA